MDKKKSKGTFRKAYKTDMTIQERLDFNANALKNMVWYRGDSSELSQLYSKYGVGGPKSFWGAESKKGVLKKSTGFASKIVNSINNITLSDFNAIDFKDEEDKSLWDKIAKYNKFKKLIEKVNTGTLVVGDGALKITYDESISDLPLFEYYTGDNVEFNYVRGRIVEVIFKTEYVYNDKNYLLYESYGYGYIKSALFDGDAEIPLDSIPQTTGLSPIVTFGGYTEDEEGNAITRGDYMLACPIMYYNSSKYEGRGKSVFDGREDIFDAIDEIDSQIIYTLRQARPNKFIPDCFLEYDSKGNCQTVSDFDNEFTVIASTPGSQDKEEIKVVQADLPISQLKEALYLKIEEALVGLLSPSTLGFDLKKTDNAESQREKEKTTLYTRSAIVETLSEALIDFCSSALRSYYELHGMQKEVSDVSVEFGDYAAPDSSTLIEMLTKTDIDKLFSRRTRLDIFWGDSKSEEWKDAEEKRMDEERGVVEVSEPDFGFDDFDDGFGVNTEDE